MHIALTKKIPIILTTVMFEGPNVPLCMAAVYWRNVFIWMHVMMLLRNHIGLCSLCEYIALSSEPQVYGSSVPWFECLAVSLPVHLSVGAAKAASRISQVHSG